MNIQAIPVLPCQDEMENRQQEVRRIFTEAPTVTANRGNLVQREFVETVFLGSMGLVYLPASGWSLWLNVGKYSIPYMDGMGVDDM